MKISNTEDGTITVNGLTYLQFANEFKGYFILNKSQRIVPKYILFWQGIHPEKIKEKFTLVNR